MTNPNQLQFDHLVFTDSVQPADIIRLEGSPETPDDTWVQLVMKALKLVRRG